MSHPILYRTINSLTRILLLILVLSVFFSLCIPIFHDAAARAGTSGLVMAPQQERLGEHLPELRGVRDLRVGAPSAPPAFSNSRPCFDCAERNQVSELMVR